MHVCKCNCMYVCMCFEFLYIDISIYNSTPQTKIFDSILDIYMHVCKCKCNCMYVCVLNFSILIYQYVIQPTKLKFLAPPLIVNIWYKIASELEVLTEELPEYSHF